MPALKAPAPKPKPEIAVKFGYLRDPLFLACSAAYCLNRLALKPHIASPFLRNWLNDLLLAPCAMPVLLWLFKQLDLRAGDSPPTRSELATVLVSWTILFEVVGPRFLGLGTGDWRDAVMYALGALGAALVWGTRYSSQRA